MRAQPLQPLYGAKIREEVEIGSLVAFILGMWALGIRLPRNWTAGNATPQSLMVGICPPRPLTGYMTGPPAS